MDFNLASEYYELMHSRSATQTFLLTVGKPFFELADDYGIHDLIPFVFEKKTKFIRC